jgi:hypothetical protein
MTLSNKNYNFCNNLVIPWLNCIYKIYLQHFIIVIEWMKGIYISLVVNYLNSNFHYLITYNQSFKKYYLRGVS